MKLSRSVAYALQATLLLAEARTGSPVPCSRLAEAGKMPERFLLQILRNLVTQGILESTRGVDGGYALRRPVSDISLLDLIEAVEGPMEPTRAMDHGLTPGTQNRMHQGLQQLTGVCRTQLKGVRISSMVSPKLAAR